MQRIILAAAALLGIITTAHAQTATGTGTDPLSVPASPLPFSSFSAGSPAAATSGSSTSSPAGGSSSGISAPASRSSQAPLELPGEGLDSSTQSATSSAAAAPSASSAICAPSIPTTDGGSANITVIDGFSSGGC